MQFIRPLLVFASAIILSSSCKISGPFMKSQPGDAEVPITRQGTDKESESVVGIPGYKLACEFEGIPTSLEPTANMSCNVTGNQETDEIEWTIDRPDGEQPIIQTTQGQQDLIFNIETTNRDLTLDIASRTIIKAQLNRGVEITALGRHLLEAEQNTYRVGARCQGLFSLLLTDDQALFTKAEVSRFRACETLAEALNKKTISKAANQQPVLEPGPTVTASCPENNTLTLQINTPELQATQAIGPIERNACRHLVRLIHELGL